MRSVAAIAAALVLAPASWAAPAAAKEPLRVVVEEPGPFYGWWPGHGGPSRRFVARSLAFAECRDRLRYLADPMPRIEDPQVYRFQREDHCARLLR